MRQRLHPRHSTETLTHLVASASPHPPTVVIFLSRNLTMHHTNTKRFCNILLCIILRIHCCCTILGHAGKNEYLIVHIHCHIQPASATTDRALPLHIPHAVIWEICTSLPIGSQLRAVAPCVLLCQLRWGDFCQQLPCFWTRRLRNNLFCWTSML